MDVDIDFTVVDYNDGVYFNETVKRLVHIEHTCPYCSLHLNQWHGGLRPDQSYYHTNYVCCNGHKFQTIVLNAKSQATDAALSRQVACTDGLGITAQEET